MFRDSQVVAAFIKGLTIAEVAALFGITEFGVLEILRRALSYHYKELKP